MFDGKIMIKKKNKKSQSTRQNHKIIQVDLQKMNSNGAIAGGENLIYISPSRVCSIFYADTCFKDCFNFHQLTLLLLLLYYYDPIVWKYDIQIRFQHSRIRPYFSGCGRGVKETLEEIRRGELEPCDLPPIQVLVGSPSHNNVNNNEDVVDDENDDDDVGPWYYSLNNRRLWVFKQCHKEGLLDNARYNNLIAVRVRRPKSEDEIRRYTIANCALEAKFTRTTGDGGGGGSKEKEKEKERNKNNDNKKHSDSSDVHSTNIDYGIAISRDAGKRQYGVDNNMDTINRDIADSDSKSDDGLAHKNPFSVLL